MILYLVYLQSITEHNLEIFENILIPSQNLVQFGLDRHNKRTKGDGWSSMAR